MASKQILRSSLICYQRFFTRFGSTLSKESSSSQNKSANKNLGTKSSSEYLADDMYNYTTFSYYDIETSMTKFRLPQPSSKPSESAPQKK